MEKNKLSDGVTMFYGATPLIFERAKALRKNATPAERHLWEQLSRKQLGVKFRRQHPINRFIVDFYCHEYKLVIELDGGVHNTFEAREYDEMRTYLINEYGVKVIRFLNEEILYNLKEVLEVITKEITPR